MRTMGELTTEVVQDPDIWKAAANHKAKAGGMDQGAFYELLSGFWAGLGRKDPTPQQVKVWYYCLSDLTPVQFAHAIGEFLTKHGDKFPTISLLRELSGIQAAADAAALQSWVEALHAVRHASGYRTPQFADPVTSHVIESFGGWPEFSGRTTEELHKFVRPQFLKAYAALASQGIQHPVELKNLIEIANTSGRIGYEQTQRLAQWSGSDDE